MTSASESPLPGTSRRVSILGATGSIGRNTLDLIGREPTGYHLVALTGQANVKLLAEQARQFKPEIAVIGDAALYADLKHALADTGVAVAAGADAVVEAASRPADWTMAAIVGAAGLKPTLAAVRQGKSVALATKECLVCAGEVFMSEVAAHGTTLLPVDSEHSAAFQAIDNPACAGIEQVVLTASGGPFRTLSAAEMAQVTPEQALKHPNWSMGPKISIDSATMMNKGLEVIEAFYLFPLKAEQLGVIIHPQSIVHCFVHYCDGSVLAQLSIPDMRTPIAYSLGWPKRINAPTRRLDLAQLGVLHFEAPDEVRFPALRIAREALLAGGFAPVILNAANEIAVTAFLQNQISFQAIPAVVEETLAKSHSHISGNAAVLDDVLAADAAARRLTRLLCPQMAAA